MHYNISWGLCNLPTFKLPATYSEDDSVSKPCMYRCWW